MVRRCSVLALLFALFALSAGVCHHGHHGHDDHAALTVPYATSGTHHGPHSGCTGPGTGEHAGVEQRLAAAVPSADRERSECGDTGRAAPRGHDRAGDARPARAPTRAGPPAAGHPLLIAIGVNRN